jgi:hypothetical protein
MASAEPVMESLPRIMGMTLFGDPRKPCRAAATGRDDRTRLLHFATKNPA